MKKHETFNRLMKLCRAETVFIASVTDSIKIKPTEEGWRQIVNHVDEENDKSRQAEKQEYCTFMRELHISGLRTEDPMQVYINTYNQAIIELAGNTNNQHEGE
jgi:hypothetical protein